MKKITLLLTLMFLFTFSFTIKSQDKSVEVIKETSEFTLSGEIS